jgi:hypothetical protein
MAIKLLVVKRDERSPVAWHTWSFDSWEKFEANAYEWLEKEELELNSDSNVCLLLSELKSGRIFPCWSANGGVLVFSLAQNTQGAAVTFPELASVANRLFAEKQ